MRLLLILLFRHVLSPTVSLLMFARFLLLVQYTGAGTFHVTDSVGSIILKQMIVEKTRFRL